MNNVLNDVYVNRNYCVLYKTPMFNRTDSIMFKSAEERDLYFDSITDKIVIEEFTDLYEGRTFNLPYNYVDLKRYNTMKLYYDDGLGHTATYYCNVDNYIYVSTDVCTPIYRIDYFLTFGHLLYGKQIDMFTSRRTVRDNELVIDMKADEDAVPRIEYNRYKTFRELEDEELHYVIYLNKTSNNQGKKGIDFKLQLDLGVDSEGHNVFKTLDNYQVGCYIVISDKDHIGNILNNEPVEYIEKIVEANTPVWSGIDATDYATYESNGYVYLTRDVVMMGYALDEYLIDTFEYIYDKSQTMLKLYPTHDKKIFEWLPYTGYIIQGNEFNKKDFSLVDLQSITGDNGEYSVDLIDHVRPTIYFYNFLEYTYAYPLGYKNDIISYDYMVKWQSGRYFSYTSDYTNSLAYKELQEYNAQAVKYANESAGLQSYYAMQLANNANQQLDVSKQQSLLSYQSQINSYSNSKSLTNIQEKQLEWNTGVGLFGSGLKILGGNILGGLGSFVSTSSSAVFQGAANNSNMKYYQSQIDNTQAQSDLVGKSISLQKQANTINAQFQCDTAALSRDNTIANIAISNKYNNAKPNAYNATDFTRFTSYFYTFNIDTDRGGNDTLKDNLRCHYNVLGTYVGYLEKWDTTKENGAYFNYIQGSILDNSNKLFEEIDSDLYSNLLLRIEEGIRLWRLDAMEWFGNLRVDNTYLKNPEPYNTLDENEKKNLEDEIYTKVYTLNITTHEYPDKDAIISWLNSIAPSIERSYMEWFILDPYQPWGTKEIPQVYKDKLEAFVNYLNPTTPESKEGCKFIVSRLKTATIYQKQYAMKLIDER